MIAQRVLLDAQFLCTSLAVSQIIRNYFDRKKIFKFLFYLNLIQDLKNLRFVLDTSSVLIIVYIKY